MRRDVAVEVVDDDADGVRIDAQGAADARHDMSTPEGGGVAAGRGSALRSAQGRRQVPALRPQGRLRLKTASAGRTLAAGHCCAGRNEAATSGCRISVRNRHRRPR